jgi:hypothetical protein
VHAQAADGDAVPRPAGDILYVHVVAPGADGDAVITCSRKKFLFSRRRLSSYKIRPKS